MSKICGYSCEHNKSGVCQISGCDKKSIMSDKTEVQTFTRYIDPTITKLQQENKQLKIQISAREEVCNRLESNWNKLKKYIRENIIYDDVGMKILDPSPLEDYMQELEQGSDSNV